MRYADTSPYKGEVFVLRDSYKKFEKAIDFRVTNVISFCYPKVGGEYLAKMGRPTDSPKDSRVTARVDGKTKKYLTNIVKSTILTKQKACGAQF